MLIEFRTSQSHINVSSKLKRRTAYYSRLENKLNEKMHALYGTKDYEDIAIKKIENVLNDKDIPNYLKLEGIEIILKEGNARRKNAIGLFLLT